MENLKVSVIVPIYNSEKYLRKCVDSILNQKYSNLEIILVNDGSTDSSGEIIDKYAERDSRVIPIHKKNGGIGTAYEEALKNMTGDCVSFIDSDDYVHLDMYQELVKTMEEFDSDIVQFGMQYIDCEGNYGKKREYVKNVIEGNDRILQDYLININKAIYGPHLTLRFAKSDLLKGCSFLSQSQGMDEITTLKIIMKANKIAFIDKVYYYCLERKNSVGRMSINRSKLIEQMNVYKELIALLKDRKEYQVYPRLRYCKYLMINYLKFSKYRERDILTIMEDEFKKTYNTVSKDKIIKNETISIRFTLMLFYYFPSFYYFLGNKSTKKI